MRKTIVFCIIALLLFSACGEQPAAETEMPARTETTVAMVTPPPPTLPPVPETETPDVTEPPATPEPPPPTDTPVPDGPDAAFADAAFLGNSLVDGLRRFGGLEQGEFFAMESASVINAGMLKNTTLSDGEEATLLDALCENEHGKIYVLFGINEISFAPEYFARLYAGVLDEILAREPDTEIYVMSLTPVTKAKNDEGSYFTMEAVNAYNAALRELSDARGFHYIDLVEALAGEDGFLPEEDSTDGIHLTRETYPIWSDYLRTHI